MFKKIVKSLVLILVFILSSCVKSEEEIRENMNTRILIWHSFINKDAEVFKEILNSYQRLYPEIKIVSEYVNKNKITQQFIIDSKFGLGPDLAFVDFFNLSDLYKSQMIKELTPDDLNLDQYLPITLPQIYVKNKIYAVPFSLKVWQAFKEHNIMIPFPQRTLHIQSYNEH